MEQEQTDFRPKTLDDVINVEPPVETPKEPEPEKPQEPVVTPEAEAAKAEGDQDAEPQGDKQPDEPPASETPKEPKPEPTVPLAALEDERRKRQSLQSEVSAIKQRLNQQARPDPDLDPEAAAEYDRSESNAKEYKLRCDISQEMMRQTHADYDEVESIFMDEVATNPALAVELGNHPVPAKFAYTEGLRLQKLKEMGADPVAYIEQVKAEATKAATEAVMAELKKAQGDSLKNALPESLADAPSAPEKDVKAWSGPTPLKNLIGT